MSMSRKHYVAIAKEIAEVRENAAKVPYTAETAIELIATGLAAYFSSDNPQFDYRRFKDATNQKRTIHN